jgi:hypothetical protein
MPDRSASRRSSESARCAPRLLPASACTSSTMTVSTLRSVSLALDVSSRNSDSGVVIRMSGGLPVSLLRSSPGVSPVRTATRMSGTPSPRRCAAWRMPARGARRFLSISAASAFSGDTYRHLHRRCGSAGGGAPASPSSAHRKAASVFPEPVGAMTSVSSPFVIAAHACSCAGVGPVKTPENQARVAGEKPSSTPPWSAPAAMSPSCTGQPTFPRGPGVAPRRARGNPQDCGFGHPERP